MSPKEPDAPKVGRPSIYSDALAGELCGLLAAGHSLVSICKMPSMPSTTTVYRWLAENAAFRDLYARSREDQADTLADEILDIADQGSNDWMETHDADNPGWRFNGEHIQRSRLRVDVRKWIASKMKPKKYGERSPQADSGDANGPIRIEDESGWPG